MQKCLVKIRLLSAATTPGKVRRLPRRIVADYRRKPKCPRITLHRPSRKWTLLPLTPSLCSYPCYPMY
ncbi:hypothetical protein EMIT0P265_30576 [Pseudomonas zeae]